MACWKTRAYFYELREATDSLQKELWEKDRAVQIISEKRRLVAKEQRPTGPGAILGLQLLTCCSRYCTHISHNPGILKARCFLIRLDHNRLFCASDVKSRWNFCNCWIGDILFPEMFIYCTAIIAKPVTGWIFPEPRLCALQETITPAVNTRHFHTAVVTSSSSAPVFNRKWTETMRYWSDLFKSHKSVLLALTAAV